MHANTNICQKREKYMSEKNIVIELPQIVLGNARHFRRTSVNLSLEI